VPVKLLTSDNNEVTVDPHDIFEKIDKLWIDIAGDKKESGNLKTKRGTPGNPTQKAQSIMNKLESTEDKKAKIVSEEMNKMKNLIGYNRKTQ
jgi:hypothetical protein